MFALWLLFYLVLTPLALLLRLFGYDPLRLRSLPGAGSVWLERSPQSRPEQHMREQR